MFWAQSTMYLAVTLSSLPNGLQINKAKEPFIYWELFSTSYLCKAPFYQRNFTSNIPFVVSHGRQVKAADRLLSWLYDCSTWTMIPWYCFKVLNDGSIINCCILQDNCDPGSNIESFTWPVRFLNTLSHQNIQRMSITQVKNRKSFFFE